MCANETVTHQPKAVHHIAAVSTMYLFQHSFVNLPRIKESNSVLYVRVKLPCLMLFQSALELTGTYLTVLIEKVSLCEDYRVNVNKDVSVV